VRAKIERFDGMQEFSRKLMRAVLQFVSCGTIMMRKFDMMFTKGADHGQ